MLQDNVLNGELSRLQWGPELIEGVVLASQAADGFVSMELHDGKPLFLKSGDQLSALAMPASPQAETATGMLRVARRGLLLDQWFDRLRAGTSAEANDALSAKPLRREAVMRAISHDWGVPWVSSSVASLSPPMLLGEQVVPQPSANHATFSRYCGSCHATTEAFPPNFLYGNSVAVDDKLRHCAERIYYRLALWDVAELERPKAAMPPVYSLGAHHVSAAQWVAHDDLAALRQSAYDLLSESTRRSPAEFLKQDYGRLQPCVVNNVTH